MADFGHKRKTATTKSSDTSNEVVKRMSDKLNESVVQMGELDQKVQELAEKVTSFEKLLSDLEFVEDEAEEEDKVKTKSSKAKKKKS